MTTLGLVGLGPMGRNYLKVISEIPNCQIKYICSRSNESLKAFPKDKIKTTDYKSFIDFPLDGVIIATPSITHYEIASFFIKHKIPIIIEKPLSLNFKDAKVLTQLQSRFRTKVLVGHTLLYNPAFIEFKKNLRNVGKVTSIEFIGGNNNPRTDDSILYDWGSHGISLILNLLGKDPLIYKLISVSKNKDGQVEKLLAEITFRNSIKTRLDLSWRSKIKIRKLIVTGTIGEAVFDDLTDKKIVFKKNNSSTYTFPKYSLVQPLVLELKEFINSIKKRGRIYSDINHGFKVIKILSKIEKLIKIWESNFKGNC